MLPAGIHSGWGLIKCDFIVTIFQALCRPGPLTGRFYELLLALGEWGDIPGQLGHLQHVWLTLPAGPLLARSNHRTIFELPPSQPKVLVCRKPAVICSEPDNGR